METSQLEGKDRKDLQAAADFLRAGKLVAFPTETVYGLGADMNNKKAVRAVFKTKGRPQDNPLIVHIANKRDVTKIAQNISADAKKLMQHFWPGPLTLVLEKQATVPDIVTAGLETVCVRMPSHPIALALIKAAKVPLVAPSANLSGKPSPTTAQHVLDDFRGKIAAVVDGGSCEVGIESTVIDCTSETPRILRPGVITSQQISEVLGKKIPRWKEYEPHEDGGQASAAAVSPGTKYAHYTPDAHVQLYISEREALQGFEHAAENGGTVWYLSLEPPAKRAAAFLRWKALSPKTLYAHFRAADKQSIKTIIIYADFATQKNLGLMNRMRKAAGL
jgi:L-threonylcarbamoyladenylate synthase